MLMAVAAFIFLGSVFTFGSEPALGVDREKGEYWTYEMSTTMELMGMMLEVTGPVTYEFNGQISVAVGENDYPSNVLAVNGALSGSVRILGQDMGSVEVSMAGTEYELVGGIGVLREDLTSATDVDLRAGMFSFTYHVLTQAIAETTPPMLSEFHPESTNLGDVWIQTATVSTTVNTWENGTLANTTTNTRTLVYGATVSALESLETSAGTFKTMRVQVASSDGDYDIFWWSSDVNNYVKHEEYENGSSSPVLTMTLIGYGTKSASVMLSVALVGVATLAVAVVVLAIVLTKMKRARLPKSTQANAPEQGIRDADVSKRDDSR